MGNTGNHALLLLFGCGLLLIGGLLFLLAFRRRRRGTEVCCGNCGFELTGLNTEPQARCPECGELLEGRRVRGRRTASRGMWIVGLVLLLLGFYSAFAALQGGAWGALNAIKPAFVLQADTYLGGETEAQALQEFETRISSGTLGRGWVDRLVRRGLELQADETRRWNPGYGDVIEAATLSGYVGAADWAKYVKVACRPDFLATRRIAAGDAAAWRLSLGPSRVSQRTGMDTDARLDELTIDGETLGLLDRDQCRLTGTTAPSGSMWVTGKLNTGGLRPGRHLLRGRLKYGLADGSVSESVEITQTIDVLGSGEQAHRMLVQPELRERVRQGLALESLHFKGAVGHLESDYTVKDTDWPVDAAFELILRVPSPDGGVEEQVVGHVVLRKMAGRGQHMASGTDPVELSSRAIEALRGAGAVEVEFRPSLAGAKREPDLFEIWGEPVRVRVTPRIEVSAPGAK